MNISRQSLEIILDLIEIKISALHIHDNDDARELNKLRKCKQELMTFLNELSSSSLEKVESRDPKRPPVHDNCIWQSTE
jgi:hypothetical protein